MARQASKEPPKNFVRGETNTLELANLGHAINLRVYQKSSILGRLQVGQGSLAWIPRGWWRHERIVVPWKVFATMMKEWPFGGPFARLKFADGGLHWRGLKKKRGGRKVSWAEFVVRMEAPLTRVQRAEMAEVQAIINVEKRKIAAKRAAERGRVTGRRHASEARKLRPLENEVAKLRARMETLKKREEHKRRQAEQTIVALKRELDDLKAQSRVQTDQGLEPTEELPAAIRIRGIRRPIDPLHTVYYPLRRGQELRLTHRGNEHDPTPVEVWIDSDLAGEIDAHGWYQPLREYDRLTPLVVEKLRGFVRDPKAWIDFTAVKKGICAICGRKLTNPVSIELKMGPVCRKRYYAGVYSRPVHPGYRRRGGPRVKTHRAPAKLTKRASKRGAGKRVTPRGATAKVN